MSPGTHGSTFGGNPLAMAVAKTILEVLSEDGFLEDIRTRARYLDSKLVKLQASLPRSIIEVRGRGFLRGIRLDEAIDLATLVKSLCDDHLLVVPAADNTLRLLPPLTISKQEIDLAIVKISRAMNDIIVN